MSYLLDFALAAHIHPQRFGDADAAVGLQVVLQEGDQHTGRGHTGVVEGVGEVLAAVVALDADLQTASRSDSMKPWICFKLWKII